MKLLIATNNEHKVKEYRNILKDFNIECLSLKDVNISCNIDETGTTFSQNSLIKALAIAQYSNMVILSDDSGIEIDEMKGELGVYSHRFLSENTSYHDKCKEIIKRLNNKKRTARFVCIITLLYNKDKYYQFEGVCNGSIDYEIKGNNGFGFDPIFIPNNYDKTMAELDESIKNKISHRAIACQKLVDFLKKEGNY